MTPETRYFTLLLLADTISEWTNRVEDQISTEDEEAGIDPKKVESSHKIVQFIETALESSSSRRICRPNYLYRNFLLKLKLKFPTTDSIIENVRQEAYKNVREFFDDITELIMAAGLATMFAQKNDHQKGRLSEHDTYNYYCRCLTELLLIYKTDVFHCPDHFLSCSFKMNPNVTGLLKNSNQKEKYKFDIQSRVKACSIPHRVVLGEIKDNIELVQILRHAPFQKDTYFVIPFRKDVNLDEIEKISSLKDVSKFGENWKESRPKSITMGDWKHLLKYIENLRDMGYTQGLEFEPYCTVNHPINHKLTQANLSDVDDLPGNGLFYLK
jgi:hypothetical protein